MRLKRRVTTALAVLTVAAVVMVAKPGISDPVTTAQSPDSGPAIHNDTSPPLRDISPAASVPAYPSEHNVEPMPQRRSGGSLIDPAVQPFSGPGQAPTPTVNIDGVGEGFTGPQGTFHVNSAPPDTNSAVGNGYVVEVVNAAFAVFDTSGVTKYGPVNTNTLWSGFGGLCQTDNDGDGIVRYDMIAGRFVISQFAVTGAGSQYLQCVAVSTTGDPTGSYYRYSFGYSNFPDYPKMGVWPDAYYFTYNMFQGGQFFAGAEDCAMDRAKMINGQSASQQCFTTSTSYGGLLPADMDGTTQPPSGAPNLAVALGTTTTTLAYWKLHVDWANSNNSTWTGPTTLTVSSYSEACGGGTCIPQSGTSNQLDSLADRLMFRLGYRNYGDHESLVVTHSVTSGGVSAIRWYEFRMSSGNPTVYQQGTYQPDSVYRWMGSIAMDKDGNMAVGYSTSSSSTHPGVHFTGRLAGDALGQMTQGEGVFFDGAGSQTGTLSRWGDYSSLSVDPTDGCTFWYSNEYIPSNGTFNWHTRVSSFKLGTCGSGGSNDFSISVNPTSGSTNQGGSVTTTVSTTTTSGSPQTVNLSASGLPSGATASFNPAQIQSGQSSTLTITTANNTPTGTYAITVTGTGTFITHSTTYTLTVTSSGGGGGGIQNGGFESGSLASWTSTGTTSVTTTSPHSGTYAGQTGSTSPTNGDSTLAQTFTAPSTDTHLSVWYLITCPDTVTYDWATITLKDNTTGATSTLLGKTCANTSWTKVTASITGGDNYTLTLLSHDDNYAGDATYAKWDDAVTTANPFTNPGFETGTKTGWTSAGTTSVTTSGPHSGTYAGQTGSTSPTNGDSSLAQTFTAPTGSDTLSVWYALTCPDTVTYDWATATLKDNTSGTTRTILSKVCATGSWKKISASVTAGHNYTLTIISHDDNYAGDATYCKWDDALVA